MKNEHLGPEYIIINEERWPLNHLWPSALKKLQQGEDSILEELSDRVNSDESLRSERDHLPELLYYEAHTLAAAYGQQNLAGRIYTQGKLDGTAWLSGEIDEYPRIVCPICFRLIREGIMHNRQMIRDESLNVSEDCSTAHIVMERVSEGGEFEFLVEDPTEDRENLDHISSALNCSDNFDELKSTLFTDDLIGRCLQKASMGSGWWEELPSATALRCHRDTFDDYAWTDTYSFYFHPEPGKFVADVREAERQMVKRCREAGLEGIGNYFE
jgi:hypothetical protein